MQKPSLVASKPSAVASLAMSKMSSPFQMLATVIFLDVLAVNFSCALIKSAGNLCPCLTRLDVLFWPHWLLIAFWLFGATVCVPVLVCFGGLPSNISGRPLEFWSCWEQMAQTSQVVSASGAKRPALYSFFRGSDVKEFDGQ